MCSNRYTIYHQNRYFNKKKKIVTSNTMFNRKPSSILLTLFQALVESTETLKDDFDKLKLEHE